MKKLLIILTMLTMLCGCGTTGKAKSAPFGRLQVKDGYLCDAKGEPVQLKGVSTHSLPRSERLIGEESFKEIAGWGCNVVRLAMYTEANDSYNKNSYFHDKNLELIAKGVEYATKAQMYVIIDWHILADGDPMIHMEEAKSFFDEMSKTYKDADNVIYEICNEPNGDFGWDRIKEYAEEIVEVIRANDDHALILVGTPSWSSRLDLVDERIDDNNLMYTFHFYAASHGDGHKNILKNAIADGLPVFVSEYGVCADNGSFPRDLDSSDEWMDLLDELGISSCIWSFSKAPEAASIFSSNSLKTSDFQDEDLSDTGRWFIEMLKR